MLKHSSIPRRALPMLLALAAPGMAFAHPGLCTQGFDAGMIHPLTGIDHMLAMAAVGWWSAVTQERRWWTVPLAFAACTLLGALIGEGGVLPVPCSETMIALSLVVLGALLLARLRLPTLAASAVAGVFALFHGYAHGVEMPSCGMGQNWLAGMVAATALLHVGGALAGKLAARYASWATRAAGACTALTGVALLAGVVTA